MRRRGIRIHGDFGIPHVIFYNGCSGPDVGIGGWVKRGWVTNNLFLTNTLQIVFFLLRSPSTLSNS
jgi:hypothetical protein